MSRWIWQLLRVHVQGLLSQAPHGALQDRRSVPDRLPQQGHREAADGSGKMIKICTTVTSNHNVEQVLSMAAVGIE